MDKTVAASTVNSMDASTVILAAIVASAIGALFYNLLPVYLGTAQDSKGLDNTEIGFMTSAFFFGYNLVTISAFYWIRKWSWRLVTLVAVPVATISLCSGIFFDKYSALLAATIVSGGALAALYGVGTTILADSSNPTRWFGLKIAAEGFLGAILLLVLPGTLIANYGFNGTIAGMLVTILVLSPLLFLLPARGNKTHEQELEELNSWDEIPESINHWAIWGALAAILVFISGASAVWAFMERLGNNSGFDSTAIAQLLAVSLGFATLGSLGAAALGKYFGNTRPFLACLLAVLGALLLLGDAESFATYAMGCCVFTTAFGAGIPFAVAEVAELDVDGRYAVLTVPAIGLGAMLGPGTAGVAYTGDSPVTILSLVAVTMLVTAVLTGFAQQRKQS